MSLNPFGQPVANRAQLSDAFETPKCFSTISLLKYTESIWRVGIGRVQNKRVPPVSVCGLFFLSAWRSERESGLRVLAIRARICRRRS
jgi:hypothetical protein